MPQDLSEITVEIDYIPSSGYWASIWNGDMLLAVGMNTTDPAQAMLRAAAQWAGYDLKERFFEGCERRGGVCDCGDRPCAMFAIPPGAKP